MQSQEAETGPPVAMMKRERNAWKRSKNIDINVGIFCN